MSGPHLEDNMEWVSRNRTLPFRATAVGILCLPTCSISRPWNLMDPNLDISTSSFEDPAPATVGGHNGSDSRVYVTVDWDKAPKAPNTTEVFINITSDCRGFERYAGQEPRVVATVINREVPDDFEGFVESDGHVSIEASHYQDIYEGDSDDESLEYHTIKNYGRTLAGVGLYPLDTETLEVGEGPALEYEMYLFSNHSAANVTLFISPAANYLGDRNPLEYAIVLFPSGEDQPEPTIVQPIGPNVGSNMPEGWGYVVPNAV
ncbi:hypothetical protein FOVG_18843 [Fusarium oxysporum f. sp. pisi HDV247]|uniref:Gylcosyl hydrolase 115 C-terminal domain-containing protein n=2 Tax=Fusarium oxysporum TaxID=5507 RepID=A0A420MBQ8_FUSOX|nr:hypothetical protein FOVG_18843 [Fusarium oxysporum f. sp. pisi HDV247]RKK65384.1 hypothetical protein BFJ69_g16328 [Fusarium oxysporum]